MQITIKATHNPLSEDARMFIEKKFGPLERLVSRAVSPAMLECEIEESMAVERAGAKYRAEGNLSVDGKLYRAEAEGVTLENAVDTVRDDLMRSVRDAQVKRRGFIKRGGAALKQMLRFGR